MQDTPQYKGSIKNGLHALDSTITELVSTGSDERIVAEISIEADRFPLPSDDQGIAKPPKSFDQMLKHLRQRIQIDDLEILRLKQFIREKSYFRIAYLAKLMDRQQGQSMPTFDDLIEFVEFDSYLRASIARLTPSIELYAKTTLMDLLLERNSHPEVYLDKSQFKSRSANDSRKLEQTWARCAASIKGSVSRSRAIRHQVQFHGGHIPIWVLFEGLTFGEFNMLNSCLEKQVLESWKDSVEQDGCSNDLVIDLTPKILPSLCQTVQFLRNKAAHNSRILDTVIAANPALKRTNAYWQRLIIEEETITPDQEIHSIFTGLMVMRLFYACMDDNEISHWRGFLHHLIDRSNAAKYLNLRRQLGFPDNWKELLQIN